MDKSKNVKKVLLCVSPYVSLVKKCAFNEIPLGPSLINGVLSNPKIDAACIDLNSIVNSFRNDAPLFTSNELAILSNSSLTSMYDQMERYPREYGYTVPELAELLRKSLPAGPYDCIAFSLPWVRQSVVSLVITFNFACVLARHFKESTGAKIIFGGALFSKMPPELLEECLGTFDEGYIDYVFLEEPGERLIELISRVKKGKRNITRIADITYRGRRRIKKMSGFFSFIRKNVMMLSKIGPFRAVVERGRILSKKGGRSFGQRNIPIVEPSFKVINAADYSVDLQRAFQLDQNNSAAAPLKALVTVYPLQFVRGCCFGCAFCQMATSSFNYLSPVEAVDAIERVLQADPKAKYFRFFNTHINHSPEYALSFSKEIIRRKIKICFSDSAHLRKPSNEVFQALKAAGCVKLYVGVESASDTVLARMDKKLSVKEIEEGLELLHKNGIWICVNMLTGLPFESDGDHAKNVAFIKSHVDSVNVWVISRFKLYPLVPLCLHRERYGIRLGKKRFPGCDYSFFQDMPGQKEQCEASGQKRYEELMCLLSEFNDIIADNDYLLFYCFSVLGYNKEQTARFMKEYYARVKNDTRFVNTLSLAQGYDYDMVKPFFP